MSLTRGGCPWKFMIKSAATLSSWIATLFMKEAYRYSEIYDTYVPDIATEGHHVAMCIYSARTHLLWSGPRDCAAKQPTPTLGTAGT